MMSGSCFTPIEILSLVTKSDYSCDHVLSGMLSWPLPFLDNYFQYLFLTLLIEFPIYGILLWRVKDRRQQVMLSWLLGNLISHPIFTWQIGGFARQHGWTLMNYLLVGEGAVLIFEIALSCFLIRKKLWQVTAVVIAANLISWSFS